MKARISGKDATNVALEAQKYGPIAIGAAEQTAPTDISDKAQVPAVEGRNSAETRRAPPPRVRKPSPQNDQYLAPTSDVEGYRARLQQAFGNTMSDEFVDVMLGKVVEALKRAP